MSNFEEEFNNCLHFGFIPNEPQNKIIEHFKYWQPPKPLVVVPQIVDDYIKTQKDNDYDGNAFLILKHYDSFKQDGNDSELDMWIATNFNDFLNAIANGYTVEKPQLFYLKHIDFCKTDKHYDWFTIKHSDGPLNHLRVEKREKPSTIDCKFTQQEIDSMQTGSYEQKEVEP